MLPIDPKIDPLVEILKLAYRRGLVIRQEQSKDQSVDEKKVDDETKPPNKVTHEKQRKGNKRASQPSPSNQNQ